MDASSSSLFSSNSSLPALSYSSFSSHNLPPSGMSSSIAAALYGSGGGGGGGENPSPPISSTKSSSTKSTLALVQENINSFAKQIETHALQRSKTEEERVAAIRDALSKLEKTLNGEIKRRVDAINALQSTFEQQIKNVHEKLEAIFVEKLDCLQSTVDMLSNRMNVLENEFQIEREKHLKDIEHKNMCIAKELTDLQRDFDAEKNDRQNRESEIATRLAELEQKAENKFEHERTMREKKIEAIRMELGEAKQTREETDNDFQAFSIGEITKIKDALVMESQCREAADDDIVQAVNHYTKALQDSVRLLNTA